MEKTKEPIEMEKHQEIVEKKIFLEAVTDLIKIAKTPAEFLDFLTDALSWVHHYDKNYPSEENVPSAHFQLIQIIENIIQPWFAGGDDMKEKMATGLKQIIKGRGMEEFNYNIAILLMAFGRNTMEVPDPDYATERLNWIAVLFRMNDHFYTWDDAIRQLKKENELVA